MIATEEAVYVHNILIAQFGGSSGIRDYGALAAALARPFQTFAGNELYPDVLSKAAALIESILTNHPFVDGNRRTGYVLMRLLLKKSGIDINVGEDEKYAFVIKIARGEMHHSDILSWLAQNTGPVR